MDKIALGLMSGTSADGLTVCAVRLKPFEIHCFKNYAYPKEMQARLLTAYDLRAAELSSLHFELGELYAKIVRKFLKDFKLSPKQVVVVGSHGQTIYHGPRDKFPNTLQIGEPAFLARELQVPVVSDFRPMDMALGGEGAPLMPAFDQFIWGRGKPKILLNIGGISNFSVVGKGVKSIGFDTGPGNTLMDLVCQQVLRLPFDKNGVRAAKGTPDKKRVQKLLQQKYFLQKPPKSLDKNDFGEDYLNKHFNDLLHKDTVNDLLATLAWFTATSIAKGITDFIPKDSQREVVVSGGGCYNKTLLRFLAECLPHVKITTSLDYHMDPQAKESAAFAFFAWQALQGKTNHCAQATGAKENAILGKITLCKKRV